MTKDVEFNTLGSPTINSAIAGLPISGIFANGNRTNMYLIGSKDIHSVEDLRGKRSGVGGFGDLGQIGPETVFDFSLANEAEQELEAERWKP